MSEHAHSTNETHAHNAHAHGEGKWELWLALLSGALLLAGWLAGRSLGDESLAERGLYAAACLAGAWARRSRTCGSGSSRSTR
jgi:hypothetical protein